jgi:hypothetical protein
LRKYLLIVILPPVDFESLSNPIESIFLIINI